MPSTKQNKRKQNPDAKSQPETSVFKKQKVFAENNTSKKPFKPLKVKNKPFKANNNETKGPLTKREGRVRAKELAEARKKRRKPHYTLEQELARLWEKMRLHKLDKQEKSKLISQALQKMKGKIPEIAASNVSSRVLQTCVKHCSQPERDSVFGELRPHFLTFACNNHAVHLVTKLLDNASKNQLAEVISLLRGHVASLLRHTVGSVVVELAYHLGNATQRQELLVELYSTELKLFKDLASIKESRLVDIIAKLNLQKSLVIAHMTSVIQPILEKGIVDHSIIHRVLIEYLAIADKSSAADIVQQLSGPLLVRMIHTRDGSKIGVLCVKHGNAKERKKIIKGMKGLVGKTAHDQYGSLVLAYIVSTVDDTKLITKIVIRELQTNLKELVLDKNGRRPLLQLLHPNCSRYFSPDDMASFNISIPSLSSKAGMEVDSELKSIKDEVTNSKDVPVAEDDKNANLENVLSVDGGKDTNSKDVPVAEDDKDANLDNVLSVEGGKKDPSLRRQELLVDSGFAENIIDVCTENVGELLRSNFGKEVLYEVASGGSGGILCPTLDDKLKILHEAIALLAAEPKSKEEQDHVLENFHASRTIRKLVLDCPTFAATLWAKALEGKCESWAKGHSSKVILAFLQSQNANICELAMKELQPLLDSGVLIVPENKQPSKKG